LPPVWGYLLGLSGGGVMGYCVNDILYFRKEIKKIQLERKNIAESYRESTVRRHQIIEELGLCKNAFIKELASEEE
jgi:hypothetical protein